MNSVSMIRTHDSWSRRVLPARNQLSFGRIVYRMRRPAPQTGDDLGTGDFSRPSSLHKYGNLVHFRSNFCRGCDRTLRPFWSGGRFPARLPSYFNPSPAFRLPLAGENTLFTRGRSICLSCACGYSAETQTELLLPAILRKTAVPETRSLRTLLFFVTYV
jgi:hypothetical protein